MIFPSSLILGFWRTQQVYNSNQLNQWAVRLATGLKRKIKPKLTTHQFQHWMRLLSYPHKKSVWFQKIIFSKVFCRSLVLWIGHETVKLMWQGVALSHSWNRSSLFVTTMNKFDNEAPSMLARNSTYSQGSEKFYASFMLHTVCSIPYTAWDYEIRDHI